MHARDAGSTRGVIRELDGLRGLAIATVLVHRFWPRTGPWHAWSALPDAGWVGVDLFFVLSGFLITGILIDTKGAPAFFRNFYARRALRIFPLYYAFVALCFVLIPLAQSAPWASTTFVHESGSPAWYLLYVGNLREAWLGHEPANFLAPMWSLSIEEQFYLTFPLVVARLSLRTLARTLAGVVVAALLVRIATTALWPSNERVQYVATWCRMDAIAVGGLVAIFVRSPAAARAREWAPAAARLGAWALLAALAAGLLDRTTTAGRTIGYSVVAGAFALVVLGTVTGREQSRTAWLRWRPLRALGRISYGAYVFHRPALMVTTACAAKIGIGRESIVIVPLSFVVTVIVAQISWRAFESRILNLKDRFRSQRHPAELREAA
jgi:peptidoglycan/LPS O-acetylase OafA/YrhL